MPYTYDYPKPAVTVDCVVFGLDEDKQLKVMLIQRDIPPFEGKWALPGGFVRLEETLEEAARRELREETGIDQIFLEQLYTFGEIKRDPRKILKMNLLTELNEKQTGVSHRAAQLYQFDEEKYLQLKQKGFNFEI
jgi:ADP-ribose pyrophosphatase YjhB (NUDIX family)